MVRSEPVTVGLFTRDVPNSDSGVTGAYRFWKVVEIKNQISRPGKSWNQV